MTADVQRSRIELQQYMSPEEIHHALHAGEFSELLAGRDPGDPPAEDENENGPQPGSADQGVRGKTYASTRAWLRTLTPHEIVSLHRSGALDDVLRGDRS
jgi:hypothetical protein